MTHDRPLLPSIQLAVALLLMVRLVPAQDDLIIPRADSRPAGNSVVDTTASAQSRPASRPAGPTPWLENRDDLQRRPPIHTLSQRIAIGGYFDIELTDRGEDENRTFRLHRLVPMISADIDERASFHAEIEIEDGHEVEVEFAHLDYRVRDFVNLRAGVILTPLGKLNLVHDSPIQELTDRPLVDTFVIPTTLREAGAGLFGSAEATERLAFNYETYVTGGFRGLLDDGTPLITQDEGLREARPHEEVGSLDPFEDNNNGLAWVGRVAATWFPGIEIGASAHTGSYDDRGDDRLTIVAIDGFVNLGGLFGARDTILRDIDIQGEWARAFVARDARAVAAGVADDLDGWYVQANWRLYPGFVDQLVQKGYLGEGARFTAVTRCEAVDLDGAGRQRWTFGLNFRPNRSQTVLKTDFQLNDETGSTPRSHNDAFLISLATYF